MDKQIKIERYLLNQMSESEKADFKIDMHNDPKLKEQVELEAQIVEQIQNQAFVDDQINKAKEELKQEKFERYLTDRMTESEKADFEDELKNNPLLKEQFDIEAKIVDQIKDSAFVNNQINTAQKEIKKGRSIRMRYYSIASMAAILVLVFVTPILYNNHKFNNLYKENFTSIDSRQISGVNRSGTSPDEQFITALSNMGNGKMQDARIILEELHKEPPRFKYYEDTRWYLALVHLRLHYKSKVEKYLKEVINLNGKYKDDAVALKNKL
jgi:hypothetical protein